MDAYKVLKLPETATKAEVRRAYRELARRWHPDRFAAGPERDWANEKMAEINAAYRACLNGGTVSGVVDEGAVLSRARGLISEGRCRKARQLLMSLSTRCAEWNYLFGLALLELHETEKAEIYLGIAARQKPEEPLYAGAYARASARRREGLLERIFGKKTR